MDDTKEKDLISKSDSKVEATKELLLASEEKQVEFASDGVGDLTSETAVKIEEIPADNSWETNREADKEAVKLDSPIDETDNKKPSVFGWGLLGFFLPLVGLTLFIVWGKKPEDNSKAKASGIGALVGSIAYIILAIVTVFLFIFMFASTDSSDSSNSNSLSDDTSLTSSSDTDTGRADLKLFVNIFNKQSKDQIEDMGTDLFDSIFASLEKEDTIVITLVLNEEKSIDKAMMGPLLENSLNTMLRPFLEEMHDEIKLNGIDDFQLRFVLENADGTEILNSLFTEDEIKK